MWHKASLKYSRAAITASFAFLWLILISFSHYWLNTEYSDREVIDIGYMPVITNLAVPLLDHVSKNGTAIRFNAIKYSSFAEMAEALRSGHLDVAYMIAPLSIVLRQQGEDIKVIYIGNRHESTLVARKDLNATTLDDLEGKTIAVPMRYSGHNISILKLLEERDLSDRINVVEMNPPDMAAALSVGALDAYFVGEPFAAQTLKSGDATLLLNVEDVWDGFICNLAVVRKETIDEKRDAIEMLVKGAVRSGLWARDNPEKAAEIASHYWNQPVELLNYALTTPPQRVRYDLYVPKHEELQFMADQMQQLGLIKENIIGGLIEDSFAQDVDVSGISGEVESILASSSD